MRIFSMVVLSLIFCCSSPQKKESKTHKNESKWHNLTNMENLDQWEVLNGSAAYKINEGVITGTTTLGSPNTFLATKRRYGDFILELEVFVDSTINSGIQFRSNQIEAYRQGVVHGYQCEIDPSKRSWSGGIYDEQRRGWLYDMDQNPVGKEAFQNGKWNQYRIEAIGPSLRTWVNGINTANLLDSLTSEGFIALQVHSIGDSSQAGKTIKWRDIRVLTNDLEVNRWSDNVTAPLKQTSTR